jgi:hypothetical protein
MVDPVTIVPGQMSFHSKFHYALGTMVFVLAPASSFCFVVCDPFSKDSTWRSFRRRSLGLGIVMVLGVVFFKVAMLPPASNPLHPWIGAIQRATVIPFLVWLFTFGLVMLRRNAVSVGLSREISDPEHLSMPERRTEPNTPIDEAGPCHAGDAYGPAALHTGPGAARRRGRP